MGVVFLSGDVEVVGEGLVFKGRGEYLYVARGTKRLLNSVGIPEHSYGKKVLFLVKFFVDRREKFYSSKVVVPGSSGVVSDVELEDAERSNVGGVESKGYPGL